MVDSTDMATPVTRGELRAEFEQFEIRLDQKLDQRLAPLATKAELEQRLAPLATKAELELWGGALLARLLERIDGVEQRLLTELARHTRASYEEMSTQISIIDEKYTDLPPRVSRLETKVFAPKRR